MVGDHGKRIKDDTLYEGLRAGGTSKEKAARIANARAGGTLDRNATRLEDRTKAELYAEAKRIGITGRSELTKAELIDAIRGH